MKSKNRRRRVKITASGKERRGRQNKRVKLVWKVKKKRRVKITASGKEKRGRQNKRVKLVWKVKIEEESKNNSDW